MRKRISPERLRRLRDERGLSQQELAVAAEISTATVSRIETGQPYETRRLTVRALASALGVPADALLIHDPHDPSVPHAPAAVGNPTVEVSS